MKTVKACGGEVLRMSDNEAKVRVKRGEAKYVPKSAWKAIRPDKPATSVPKLKPAPEAEVVQP